VSVPNKLRWEHILCSYATVATWPGYVRVMGIKEVTVCSVGFARLAIFRPGIIVGNAQHPGLGRLVGKPRAWVVWQY